MPQLFICLSNFLFAFDLFFSSCSSRVLRSASSVALPPPAAPLLDKAKNVGKFRIEGERLLRGSSPWPSSEMSTDEEVARI